MTIDAIRQPPCAIDAEQAVLGSLMLSERAWWDVCDLLASDDFYRRDHRVIFRAIAELRRAEKPCDAVTLGDWFQVQNISELAGGASYVIELANNTPSAANVRAYAGIVAEKSMLRRMIDAGTELVSEAFDPAGRAAIELVGVAQSRLSDLLSTQPCELEPLQPVMQRVWSRLAARYDAGAGIHGLTTGLADLDELIGGLRPGQLGLIAARPKQGKTTLAQNIAEHVALTLRKAVAIFSFEMQPDELGDRMLSSQGNVAASRVRSGALDEIDWASVSETITRLQAVQLYVSRPKRARVDHVIAQMRRQHARTPLALAVIDYLQLMEAPGDNRAQAIGDITRALKLAAGELGIPILLLSQLNRRVEERTDKRPLPSDLRDSGSIEQDADFVLFIYRDEVYNTESRYRGTAELIVALQRNGPTGDVRVLYHPERFRFENLPEYWAPTPAKDQDDTKIPRAHGFRRGTPRPRAGDSE